MNMEIGNWEYIIRIFFAVNKPFWVFWKNALYKHVLYLGTVYMSVPWPCKNHGNQIHVQALDTYSRRVEK